MAFQHCFSQELSNTMSEAENSNGCFDCNICLDFAHDPIVTLCGHLYCWPCIYKWLHVQSDDSLGADEHPQCPVCKDVISHTTMIPLYGRGGQAPPSGKSSCCDDTFVPPRPTASAAQALLATASQSDQQQRLPYRNPYQGQHLNSSLYQEEDAVTSQMHSLGSHHHNHPMVEMFGEMVFAGVFGNSPNSYQMVGNNSSRLRRQELQTDKFLNRISNFLFCCFILCLLVF
ncbi:E3 ubiquitin-protein ligase RMA1H1-like [Cicer arietinum]|uniref:E3 ubiquitin-protein ligase RMA n=1 Tax=Cicer arietinum TaxID=3827 RepID=A0A1S2XBQ5_CICAR|nr:E3 ubiquitin-protein ligase RMA1H1-like [Cicer arietinum]XP_004485778.1 E3 ubiquitin-protein ligase RMA1H1-like [Cicer arietinum]